MAVATVKILFICGGSRLWGGEWGSGLCFWKHGGERLPGPPQAAFWTAHIPRITAHGFLSLPPGQGVQRPHLRPRAGEMGAVRRRQAPWLSSRGLSWPKRDRYSSVLEDK